MAVRAQAGAADKTTDADPWGGDERSSGLVVSRNEAVALVQRCCDMQVTMTLIDTESGTLIQGRFDQLLGDRVWFVWAPPDRRPVWPLDLCCVTFYLDDRAYVFVEQVRQMRSLCDGSPVRLSLNVPERVLRADVRTSFRVPVVPAAGLEVLIHLADGRRLAPRAIDLSVGGVQVEFPRGTRPAVTMGDSCAVALRLGAAAIHLRGDVRHVSGNRCGIRFADVHRMGMANAPEALRTIVTFLERDWLNSTRR